MLNMESYRLHTNTKMKRYRHLNLTSVINKGVTVRGQYGF